jgi:glutamate--cysteine ligase
VLSSTHETCQELAQHLNEIRALSDPLDVVWLTVGRNPLVPTADMPWMPKERYGIMRRYLPTRGAKALDMMVGTSTVQTNIDYSDEGDMARKLRAMLGLSPFITALFANSPFAEGHPTGYLSARTVIWEDTDPDRTGFIPAVFCEDFGYRDYAAYALDVPMFFIYRDGHYVDLSGQSFRRFLEEGLDGYQATEEDWALHLTTLFPNARLKQYLELRMADVGPVNMICAFSALTRGLFYDETALHDATLLLKGLRPADYPVLQHEAARLGLHAQAKGRPFQEWARDLLAIAEGGLKRLDIPGSKGENEVKFLEPLQDIVQSGKTLAERLLDLWEGEWAHRIDPIFSSPMTTY